MLKTLFLEEIAHDFNNVLTVIRGNSEILLLYQLPESARGLLKEIFKATEKGIRLTDELFHMSQNGKET